MSKRRIQQIAVWLAVAGFCIPQAALSAGNGLPRIGDVTLHEAGTLVGQILDNAGNPLEGVRVALGDTTGELAVAQTNKEGCFAFSGLSDGVYEVATPAGSSVYRVWTAATAPPTAERGVLIVGDGQTVRGNWGNGPLSILGKRPLLTAGLIAAAIAIPIAVTADKGPSSL